MSAEVISSRAMQWASKVQGIAEQAKDLTLEAAQSVGARYIDDTRTTDFEKLLEARSDREKIDGMRRIIILSSHGKDMSEHFASVVKNVASSNLELRKLVYIYIVQYAESQPDLALLSINTIQKALSDQNQIVRALALRVMSSIRVVSISGIVLLAIKKCTTDSSFYVRKSAAVAIAKTLALNTDLEVQLLECLKALLGDYDPSVLSSALETFELVCQEKVELIHPNFRRICSSLHRMDELSQVNVLRVLEIYVRRCFTSPQKKVDKNSTEQSDFYAEDVTVGQTTDQDLSLLHKTLEGLLQTRSPAMIVAVSRALLNLGSPREVPKIVSPLISLLRHSNDVQYVALTSIATIALERPFLWQSYAKHFFVFPTEPEYIWALKLEILTLILNPENAQLIINELSQYSQDTVNKELAKAAVAAIGRCAQRNPSCTSSCIDILFEHIKASSDFLINESVISLRHLIQINPGGHLSNMRTLVHNLEHISAPTARASIFCLVSENLSLLAQIAPDVLRIGARGFIGESESVKLQILTLAIKMYVLHCQHTNRTDVQEMNQVMANVDERQSSQDYEVGASNGGQTVTQDLQTEVVDSENGVILLDTESPVPKLYAYIVQLSRYDSSYDLRDRLRTFKVLASSPDWILTQKLLFSTKPAPSFQSSSVAQTRFNLGSSSMILSKPVKGYLDLPDWSTSPVGAQERSAASRAPATRNISRANLSSASTTPALSRNNSDTLIQNVSTISKPKSKLTGITSLDEFYATTSEEDDSDTSASEEDSEDVEGDEDDDEDEEGASSEEDGSEDNEGDDNNDEPLLVSNR